MLRGVHGQSHFELEEFIDMKSFDDIQIEIWMGIALTKPTVDHGYFPYPETDIVSEANYNPEYKSLMQAYMEYVSLPINDPIRVAADSVAKTSGHSALSTFLKYAFAAHDLHSHYPLWDQGNDNTREFSKIAIYFPKLIQWIDKLIEDKIFSNIKRAFIIGIDCNGHAHKHRDPSRSTEFLHVRPNLDRPFWVYDDDTNQKYQINSRIGWWNDTDVHGGGPTMGPSYALRIDGEFTDEFRSLIKSKIL